MFYCILLIQAVYDINVTYKDHIGCSKEALGRQFEKEAFPEMNKMTMQFREAKAAEKEITQVNELDNLI